MIQVKKAKLKDKTITSKCTPPTLQIKAISCVTRKHFSKSTKQLSIIYNEDDGWMQMNVAPLHYFL